MKKQYEKPIDSTEGMVKSGKTLFLRANTFVVPLLSASDDKWEQQAVKSHVSYTFPEQHNITFRVYNDSNTAVMLPIHRMLNDKKNDPRHAGTPRLRPCKQLIYFNFVAWIVQRNSKWLEHLNKHILLIHQVCN